MRQGRYHFIWKIWAKRRRAFPRSQSWILSSHFRSSCVPFSEHLLKTRPETPKVKPLDGDFFPLSTLSMWYTWIEGRWLWQVKKGRGRFEEVQLPKPYGRAKHISAKSSSNKKSSIVKTMEEPGKITWKRWWCKVYILVFLLKIIHVMRSRESIFGVGVFLWELWF